MRSINKQLKIILIVFLTTVVVAGGFILFSHKDKSAYEVKLPKYYNRPLELGVGNFSLSVIPLNAQAASRQDVEAQDYTVRYNSAYANTDVVQTRETNKLKEDIILKAPGHPAEFSYQLNIKDFDVIKDDDGNFNFYPKGKVDELNKTFTIPAPFMIDADGKQSSVSDVTVTLSEQGILTLTPNSDWLATAKYPVIIDPTIEINILNLHSHPQQGEDWTVEFTTLGRADLKIIPDDQATIDDDEFVSLSCNGEIRQPQILAGDVIYYPDWQCEGVGQVVHYTQKAGQHTLKFNFGGKIAYAHNAAIAVDSVSSNQGTGSTITVSHTTSGTNRLMLAGISVQGTGVTITSITYNGTALTSVGTKEANDQIMYIYKLVAPDTGTHNLVVNFSSTLSGGGNVTAITYTGVDQSTPLGTFVSAGGYGTTASVNVTSASGELVMDTISYWGCNTITVGSGQTERWNVEYCNNLTAGGSTEPGASTVTMSWGLQYNAAYAIGAVPIKPYTNSAPSITSVFGSPNPVNVGDDISFNVAWSDSDSGDLAKAFICKTNAITTSTPACTGGTWASSTSATGTSPIVVSYTAQAGDIGSNNYYAFVCDDSGDSTSACSNSTAKTFSVYQSTNKGNVNGGFYIKGGAYFK